MYIHVHVGGGVHYCNISSTKINTTKYHRKKIFCTKFTNLEEAHCLNIPGKYFSSSHLTTT